MRVTIHVRSGPYEGRCYSLGNGQELSFGRTDRSDISFRNDNQMSEVHFRMHVDHLACHLTDLESSNGTRVNDEPVDSCVLRDKDVISAGGTSFHVEVKGGAVAPRETQATTAARAPATVNARAVVTCELIQYQNGVYCYKGSAEALAVETLMMRLCRGYQQVLIVDVSHLDDEQKVELGQPEYLFNWLPEASRAAASPWVLSSPQLAADAAVVDNLWGKNTLVGVYSNKNQEPPLPQMQRCAGAFARPSVLRMQLSDTAAEVATDLLRDIEVVLVEDDDPAFWLLFSNRDLATQLEQMGLQQAERSSS